MSKHPLQRRGLRCAVFLAIVSATASCGDVVRSSQSPVMLVISALTAGEEGTTTLGSDVLTRVTAPLPCAPANPCFFVRNDFASAAIAVVPKNPTVAPTPNNAVTITRYRVEYRRADGRNTPGLDVPYPFDGAVTMTIQAGSTGSVGFELVRVTAKEESPLLQLVDSAAVISAIADVTFFGTDVVGNEVAATGSISINFANFGP